MKLAIAICSVLLVGCAHTQQPGQTIQVPVPVKCKTEEPRLPDYRYSPPYDNVFDAVRDLLGDRALAEAYENELRKALASCK